MDTDSIEIEVLEIGRRLALAREERGWTLDMASRRLGVAVATLHSYERGSRPPPLTTLKRIAGVYGRRPAWFLEPGPEEVTARSSLDPLAEAALRDLPPDVQRRLLLNVWPAIQNFYRELQPLGNVLGET